jgi:peptidyl-prolyl cis-trans isomerase SurA
LLFELTDQKVWTKAVKDTTGLRQYYENNKYNYTWPDRAEISVFTCENAEISKKVRSMIAKGDMENQAIETEINSDGKQHVELDGGTYSEEDRPLLAQFNWKKENINASDLMVNGKPVVVKVNKFIPSGPKKLSEARGVITSDYQSYLEKTWIESLRKGHQINIHKEVLYTIH